MARRRPTTASETDRAFPVRVKVHVPPTGLGVLIVEIAVWLKATFGEGAYGQGPATAIGRDACAYHFTSIDEAQLFLTTFPQLAVARPTPPPLSRSY
ncbi:hypothetical protein SAMN04488003_12731 [Loktanella fryxellensis]|uniref:Uncharacterized protein n=1 Tax=Loktanella fryxellensis TaxID=245187 RepID=A0A1H8INZ1_9RHOB|nr:hypothetical protein [Loktanella fryxellensis]SEN70670.1 hypothetical protein SAMN04488003_12731 [Loktanella fryxellensis]